MRQSVLAVMLALVASATAWGEPAASARELLEKGRVAEARGKHADAAGALEAARTLAPDDPAVLAELGWVYFELADLAKAEATTRAALGHLPFTEQDPFGVDAGNALRGAALYNLGQILEARGDKPGAIAAYADSLKARPNSAVAAHLRTLDAAKADALDPLKPTAMRGPFSSIAAYCAAVAAPGSSIGSAGADCVCGHVLPNEGARKLATGFTELAAFARDGCADKVEQELDIAVKRGDGWFVTDVGTEAVNDGPGHCGEAEWHLAGATATGAMLRVEYRSVASCFHLDSEWGWDNRAMVVLGIGPSGVPSATPSIPLELYDLDDVKRTRRHARLLERATWNKDHSLEIRGTLGKQPMLVGGDLRGTHYLVFP